MNYSYNEEQIVFLKDRDIVLSIDGKNSNNELVLSNGVPSYDLLSAQVNILSSRDDYLSSYINNYVEVSCSNLCTVVSNLINRDKQDVTYLGDVTLSNVYLDSEGEAITINTLYGLLLTNRKERERVLHKGFLFSAVSLDSTTTFDVTDGENTATVHADDFILVTNETKVYDITLNDVKFIRDYVADANFLSGEIDTLNEKANTISSSLSNEIACLSVRLSTDIDALSANLSIDIDVLSSRLSNEIDSLSTALSTDVDVLSVRLSTDIDALSTNLSTDISSLSSLISSEVINLSTNLSTDVDRLSVNLSTDISALSAELTTNENRISSYLSDYISSFVEVSCSNLCVLVKSLIGRDYKDVSFFGDVQLSTNYLDPEGGAITINTLYGLLLTNKNNRDRKMHPGFLFRANSDDALADFIVKDADGNETILHANDYILVVKEVDRVSDIALSDVHFIKDYTSDLSSLSSDVYDLSVNLSAEVINLSTNLSTDLSSLSSHISADLSDLSNNLSLEISSLSTHLSIDIDSLSTNLSTDIDSLSTRLSTDISVLSTNLSTDISVLSNNLCTTISVLSNNLCIDIIALSTNLSNDICALSTRLSTEIDDLSTNLSTDIDQLSIVFRRDINNIADDVRGGVNYKGHINLTEGRYYTSTGTLPLSGVFGAYLEAVTTEGTLTNDIELNNGWLYNITTTDAYTTKDGITFENNDYIIIHKHNLSSAYISELERSTIDIIEAVQDDYVRFYQLLDLSADLSSDIGTLSSMLCADIKTLSSNLSIDISALSTNLSTDIKTLSSNLSNDILTLSSNLCADINSLSSRLSATVNNEFVHISGDVNIGTLQIAGNVSADEFSTNEKLKHTATYGISSITYIDNSSVPSGGDSKKYTIAYPENSGTIALTSDVVNLSNSLTNDIDAVSTVLSLDISSTVAVYDDNGNFIGNKLSATKITNAAYDAAILAGTLNDQCIYIINDDYASMRGQLIRDVCDPQLSSDAATKNYVDTAINQTSANIEDLSAALSNDIDVLSANLCADIKKLSSDLSNEIVDLSTSLSTSVNNQFVHMSGDIGIGTLSIMGNVSADAFTANQKFAHTATYGISSITYIDNSDVDEGFDPKVYDIAYPEKSGTIALTSDVVNLSNNLSTEINAVSTVLSDELSSTIAVYSDNGITYVGNKLSVVKLTNADYINEVTSNTTNDKCIYVIDDDFNSAYGQQIKNVADPTVSSDAATKNYVDVISTAISSDIETRFTTKTELNALALSVDSLSTAVNYVSSDLSTLEHKHYYATLRGIENEEHRDPVGEFPDNLLIASHPASGTSHKTYYLKFAYDSLVLVECD